MWNMKWLVVLESVVVHSHCPFTGTFQTHVSTRMHSSRMRTGSSLSVSGGCTWSGGVCQVHPPT